MSVVFTSFKRAKKYPGDLYSIATFQPQGFNYSSLRFLFPINAQGERIRLDRYIDPAAGYEKALREAYQNRWHIIKPWLQSLDDSHDIVLCCWCPHSEHAREEIKALGYFHCHSGLVAKMISRHRPDITIVMDDDRSQKLYQLWNPLPKTSPTPTNSQIVF